MSRRQSRGMPRTPGKTPVRTTATPARLIKDNEALSRMTRYAQRWIDNYKDEDPVFSSPEQLLALEQSIGHSVQPYNHCPRELFPTVAAKFGLQRYLPTSSLPMGSRGLQCVTVAGKGNCHRPSLPAFLYT